MNGKCRSCPLALICIAKEKGEKKIFDYFHCESCKKVYLNYGHRFDDEIEVNIDVPNCHWISRDFYTHCEGCIKAGRSRE